MYFFNIVDNTIIITFPTGNSGKKMLRFSAVYPGPNNNFSLTRIVLNDFTVLVLIGKVQLFIRSKYFVSR